MIIGVRVAPGTVGTVHEAADNVPSGLPPSPLKRGPIPVCVDLDQTVLFL